MSKEMALQLWTRMEKEIDEAQKNMPLWRKLSMFYYGRIHTFKLRAGRRRIRDKFETNR